jgi:CRISPR-associated protein Cas5d
MKPRDQVLEVWGEFACFTRPEFKVERFSYPVITPSAARAIFDAIYCKPNKNPTKAEFRWQVTKVEVMNELRYIALRRNEVKGKAPSSSMILSWAAGKRMPEPMFADGTKDILGTDQKGRTQRQTMALRDVRYRLHAEIRPWPGHEDRIQGMEAQFRRRALNGKCIYQPYLGCREFPAFFELVEPDSQLTDPAPISMDIGLMLYDIFDLSRPGHDTDDPKISLFRAKIENGVMVIPDYSNDNEVLKVYGGKF